jgi:hypothetical protein
MEMRNKSDIDVYGWSLGFGSYFTQLAVLRIWYVWDFGSMVICTLYGWAHFLHMAYVIYRIYRVDPTRRLIVQSFVLNTTLLPGEGGVGAQD